MVLCCTVSQTYCYFVLCSITSSVIYMSYDFKKQAFKCNFMQIDNISISERLVLFNKQTDILLCTVMLGKTTIHPPNIT